MAKFSTASRKPRTASPSIVLLANRIEADIRERNLQPGDPYLSAAETARMLRVGTAAANRALQLLEQRQVLIRRQRRGTFIAPPPLASEATPKRINLIVDQNYLKTEGLLADGVLVGIQSILRQTDLRFRFMPVTDDPDFVHKMIDEVLQAPHREGFVLVRSSLTVQQLVADSGLPAVIHGTPYPSITSIPSIDRDHAQVAILMADHMLNAGCDHLILLQRQQILPGDHHFLDMVLKRMQSPDVCRPFTLRFLPARQNVVEHEVRSLLQSLNCKVGIICRSEPLAEGALEAVRSMPAPHSAPKVEIAVTDVYRKNAKETLPWAATQLTLTPQEIGARIGELLRDQFAQQEIKIKHSVIPVRLVLPDGHSTH